MKETPWLLTCPLFTCTCKISLGKIKKKSANSHSFIHPTRTGNAPGRAKAEVYSAELTKFQSVDETGSRIPQTGRCEGKVSLVKPGVNILPGDAAQRQRREGEPDSLSPQGWRRRLTSTLRAFRVGIKWWTKTIPDLQPLNFESDREVPRLWKKRRFRNARLLCYFMPRLLM